MCVHLCRTASFISLTHGSVTPERLNNCSLDKMAATTRPRRWTSRWILRQISPRALAWLAGGQCEWHRKRVHTGDTTDWSAVRQTECVWDNGRTCTHDWHSGHRVAGIQHIRMWRLVGDYQLYVYKPFHVIETCSIVSFLILSQSKLRLHRSYNNILGMWMTVVHQTIMCLLIIVLYKRAVGLWQKNLFSFSAFGWRPYYLLLN